MSTSPIFQLPLSMQSSAQLVPSTAVGVCLLTRHSIREESNSKHNFPGYQLQLTREGKLLAKRWGFWLAHHLKRPIGTIISSPIDRCIETAHWMTYGQSLAFGLSPQEILITHIDHSDADLDFIHDLNPSKLTPVEQIELWTNLQQDRHFHTSGLLVEPGSFVIDIEQAGPIFLQQGALNFINGLLNQSVAGMKPPTVAVVDILKFIYTNCQVNKQTNALTLAVTHDTILAALIATLSNLTQLTWEDWPNMMEGLFLWFEGDSFNVATLHWIWRNQHRQLSMNILIQLALESS